METLNILLVGEASVGKTSFLGRFIDPNYEITPPQNEDEYFWSSQEAPANSSKVIEVNGKQIRLNLMEVQGSRGRSDNYFELISFAPQADCVLFCYSVKNEWSLNSFDRTMRTIESGRIRSNEAPKKVKAQKKSLLPFSQRKSAKSELKLDPTLPTFLVQTRSGEEEVASEFGDKFATAQNLTLFKVSALKNMNVQETFLAVTKILLDSREQKHKEEREAQEKKLQEEQQQQQQKKMNESQSNTKTTKQEVTGIWAKLLGKFTAKKNDEGGVNIISNNPDVTQIVKADEPKAATAAVADNNFVGEIAPLA